METESIGAVSNGSIDIAQRAGLQQEDFLKVLLAQLTYQDPLKPLDNNEFIAQFAQLTNLQQTQAMSDKLDSLLTFQAGAQAVGLLNKSVNLQTETGSKAGSVIAIAFVSGVPNLEVRLFDDGTVLRGVTLGQIQTVIPGSNE